MEEIPKNEIQIVLESWKLFNIEEKRISLEKQVTSFLFLSFSFFSFLFFSFPLFCFLDLSIRTLAEQQLNQAVEQQYVNYFIFSYNFFHYFPSFSLYFYLSFFLYP